MNLYYKDYYYCFVYYGWGIGWCCCDYLGWDVYVWWWTRFVGYCLNDDEDVVAVLDCCMGAMLMFVWLFFIGLLLPVGCKREYRISLKLCLCSEFESLPYIIIIYTIYTIL